MNYRAAALSLGLHVALVVALLPQGGAVAPPPQERKEPREDVLNVALVESSDDPNGMVSCASFYRGLGITGSWTSGHVYSVLRGGPADKAGLLVGDNIQNIDDVERDRYMAGHRLVLRVLRGDRPINITVIIGRVCTDVE